MQHRRAAAWIFGPALLGTVIVWTALAMTARSPKAWGPTLRRGSEVVGSDTCARCHAEAHESWARTWHRTMTQPALGDAVIAPFAGEQVRYAGYEATFTMGTGGRPRMHVVRARDGQVVLDDYAVLAIGSHRFQQYMRVDPERPDRFVRLPFAWHRAEQRWIPMAAAFVEPDAGEDSEDALTRHATAWNDNCLFCHNTEPVPGMRDDGRFSSRVGELGIACEACHGPGGDHVARHTSPLRRMLAHLDEGDGSIADPLRMTPERENDVCGRCHGNRIGHDLARILAEGDGFLPGSDLSAVSRPILREATIAGTEPMPFAARFWPDGTPRLSAYEYQAVRMSPCHEPGATSLGCGSCHSMHDAPADGQVRADRVGEAACVRCHEPASLTGAAHPGGHGGHGQRGDAHAEPIDCLDCHMPRVTYGLLEGMRTHHISTPDPGAWLGRHDQPDACSQCHVTATRRWLAGALPTLGVDGTSPREAAALAPGVARPPAPSDSEAALRGGPGGLSPPASGDADAAVIEHWGAQVELDLFGGDPLQRNLAADALGRAKAVGSPARRMAALVTAMDDEFPSVRWFAWRSLRGMAERHAPEVLPLLATFDYVAPVETRVVVTDAVRGALVTRYGAGSFRTPLDAHPARRDALERRRDGAELWIGE
jgi:predicted CXXCH cytochrome family protein